MKRQAQGGQLWSSDDWGQQETSLCLLGFWPEPYSQLCCKQLAKSWVDKAILDEPPETEPNVVCWGIGVVEDLGDLSKTRKKT